MIKVVCTTSMIITIFVYKFKCISVQEMLSLPDLKRRTFAVYLVVELFRKVCISQFPGHFCCWLLLFRCVPWIRLPLQYRVASTFPIVQLMVNTVNTIVQRADCVQVLVLMDKVVPVLADIAKVCRSTNRWESRACDSSVVFLCRCSMIPSFRSIRI